MPLPMPATICCSSSSATASTHVPQRPRGLWKARATAAPRSANHAPEKSHPSQKREHNPACSHHHNHLLLADLLDPLDDPVSAYDSDSSAGSRKRRRLASDTPPTSDDEVQYWDYSRQCSPHPERLSKWITRSKIMDTTTTAGPGVEPAAADRASCDLEDWEDLKELFAKAAEIYENQPPNEAILLLRGVIHECHRFMRLYYDPSVIYAAPALAEPPKSSVQTPPEQRLVRDWLDRPPLYPPPSEKEARAKARNITKVVEAPKKCKCKDLASAFYTILGTTLFFFGNLIDQDPTLAAEGEPSTPIPYWLSAIDVFEIGENLPVRTSGRGCPNAPEDWRMAVVWGRTLVCLTHEALARQKEAESRPAPPDLDPMAKITAAYSFSMPSGPFGPPMGGVPLSKVGTPDEPAWPPGSPFALIVERRLPRTGRMSLANTTPDELMLIAKDQFSRGIFHMPHPLHHAQRARKFSPPTKVLPTVFTCTPPLAAYYSTAAAAASAATAPEESSDPAVATDPEPEPEVDTPVVGSSLVPGETFSRAKELFTIASEVLDVAERFPEPASRASLAGFADGVLSQMKMEANTEHAAAYGAWAGAGAIVLARGRANLVIGAAKAEEIEDRLEEEDEAVWECDEALDGREALGVAVVYLEKAREALVTKKEEEAREQEKSGGGALTSAVVAAAAGPSPEDDDELVMVESASDSSDDEDEDEDGMDTSAALEAGPRGGGAPAEASTEDTIAEIGTMLAEALITLANLTKDAREREALYAQAQRESGDAIMLDEESDEEDDRMDV